VVSTRKPSSGRATGTIGIVVEQEDMKELNLPVILVR